MEHKKAALITGAASGIGSKTVERFAKDGSYDRVAALDIDDSIEDMYLDESGVHSIQLDIRDFNAVHDCVAEIESTANIDALVNCAGVSRYYWIGNLSPKEWNDVLDSNLTSQYNLAHAVTPRMFAREHGYVVNISSGAGQRGSTSGGVHYSASKAGIFGLTRGLAKQLAPHVRVNCVVPGLMNTPLATDSDLWSEEELEKAIDNIPLNQLGDPDSVAKVIHFLCGPGAEYMTGSVINVDGGTQLS